jgi:hypothetical protein
MKRVVAIIRPEELEGICAALDEPGVSLDFLGCPPPRLFPLTVYVPLDDEDRLRVRTGIRT